MDEAKKKKEAKRDAETIKEMIEDRWAGEKRRQPTPRRLEPEQPALSKMSPSDTLGRADAIGSVLVDDMLGIRSSRTHNP